MTVWIVKWHLLLKSSVQLGGVVGKRQLKASSASIESIKSGCIKITAAQLSLLIRTASRVQTAGKMFAPAVTLLLVLIAFSTAAPFNPSFYGGGQHQQQSYYPQHQQPYYSPYAYANQGDGYSAGNYNPYHYGAYNPYYSPAVPFRHQQPQQPYNNFYGELLFQFFAAAHSQSIHRDAYFIPSFRLSAAATTTTTACCFVWGF